jgi:hypothetical protein
MSRWACAERVGFAISSWLREGVGTLIVGSRIPARIPDGIVCMSNRELLEKAIARILHRHCNFGWAHYYIPSEKFPSLIEELVEVASPAGQVSHEELVQFFLRTQRATSVQERAARFEEEFAVYRRS